MGDPCTLEFEADVSELTQGDPAETLLPLLRQLSGWEEVTGAAWQAAGTPSAFAAADGER